MQKKITSFLILAVIFVNMFVVSAFAETTPSVTVGNATGETGNTVEIPVILENNTGFSSLGIEIAYDEKALSLVNVAASSSIGATFTKAQDFTVKPYNMSWDSASDTTFNGTLVTLTFEIIATVNGDYPVTVDYYKGRNGNYVDGINVNYNENFEPLNLAYTSGKVTVTGNDEPVIESPSVTVGNTTGKKGDTVEIPVVLSNNTGFSSLGIEIDYDEKALSLVNVAASSNIGATFTKAQDFTVKPYNMSWDSASDTNFNGTLVTLTFEIIATVNGDYPVTVDYYKGRNGNYVDGINVNYNENFEPLNLAYTSGKVTVTGNDEPVIERPSITLGNATGKKGDTVEIPVVLSNNKGFSSLGIEIGYDDQALSLVNVSASSNIGATFTKAQDFTVKPYNMSWDSASDTTFNGTLVTLTFEIITTVNGDYPITVDYYKGRNGSYVDGVNVNYNEKFEPLGLVYIGGKIEVNDNVENSITLSDDLIVTLTGQTGEGKVYAVLYDENHRRKQVKLYSSLKTFNIAFDSYEIGDTVKVMWWEDNLQPMCEAKSIVLQ